jgi:chromosome segregation ATPase
MDVEKEIKRIIASLTDINSKMSVLERKIDSMPTQTVVKTDNSVVNDSIKNINSKISLLERKLESIPNRDINNLDRDNNAISKLIEQYNALKNEIASIKEQINKSVTNQPARVVPNPSIDVQLKNNLNLLGKRIDDLEKKITSSTNQPTPIISHGNEGTEQFKKDFNDKLDEIKHRLSIIESNVKSSIDMQNQLQKLQEECKKLSKDNDEMRAENNTLKKQIAAFESVKTKFWWKIFFGN